MVGLTSARSWRQLATLVFEASRSGANWNDGRSHGWRSRIAAVVGLTAVGVGAATSEFGPLLANGDAAGPATTTASSPRQWLRDAASGRDVMIGGYGGSSYTHPSQVEIRNPGQTEMTVDGFGWDGLPFKSPVYYGLRSIVWPQGSRFGAMLDFTHAKAIARPGDVARFSGSREGQPLPANAPIRDVFRHLEFSHGHNIVTLNGLLGWGSFMPRLRPYIGIGGGVSLPHTEIGFARENGRTYEYQYAGLVGQALAGVEIRLGTASLFFEYKFTYAPYSAPLSGVVNGGLLITDLWRQFRAWTAGTAPPGGTLRTTLTSHHTIGGVLVRVGRRPAL